MNFKDNIDEEHINAEKLRFEAPVISKSWKEKLLGNISRYSLLLIVAVAALSVTLLHFKGKVLLQALRGTPLPSFGWEESIQPEAIPDKTKVYEDALKKEAKERRKEVSNKASALAKLNIKRPDWQKVHQRSVAVMEEDKADSVFVSADTLKTVVLQATPQQEKRHRKNTVKPKKRTHVVSQKEAVVVQQEAETKSVNFFQPVRVATTSVQSFTACVVHGDQQISNNSMLSLRLTQELSFDGQTFPVGTIIYGTARIAQNRILVTVSRIWQTPVQLQVHHHTFHEGILLDESENVIEDATSQTLYRQGQRSVQDLPLDVATELGRNILQASRRKKTTVFLPDGFPLYLSKEN